MSRIQKNSREEIRVSLDTFKGYELACVRVWFRDKDGEMRPSKQGVAFRKELLPDIIAALRELG